MQSTTPGVTGDVPQQSTAAPPEPELEGKQEDRSMPLVDLAKRMRRNGGSAWDDPVVRDKVAALAVRAEGMRQNTRRC